MLRGVLAGLLLLPALAWATELPAPAEEKFQQDVAWSPDGKKIAFIGGKWPKSAVYVLDIASSEIVKVVN